MLSYGNQIMPSSGYLMKSDYAIKWLQPDGNQIMPKGTNFIFHWNQVVTLWTSDYRPSAAKSTHIMPYNLFEAHNNKNLHSNFRNQFYANMIHIFLQLALAYQ